MQAISRKIKRAKMFKLARIFLASGNTQKEFCRKHDIRLSTFQFWLRQYRREKQPVPIEQTKPDQAFIPIQFSSKEQNQDPQYSWSIEYPNGVRVQFTGTPDRDMLLSLIQAA